MQKTDIWMPLYIGDYLADTSRLTTEQHGAYLLLLMDYWRSGRLPDNDQVLAQITKLSPDAWCNAKAMLMQFFSIENGYWIHSRVEKEMVLAKENKDKNHNRAVQAAKARWEKQQSNATSNATSIAKEVLEECPSPSPSPSNKNNIYIPTDVNENDFKEYLKVRKKHKKEWTERIEKRIREEGQKLGWSLQQVVEYCIEKQWANFEATWVRKEDLPKKETGTAALAELFMQARGHDVKQIT